MDNRISVILLAGFLGAGKTTLVNRLLKGEGMQNTAVIVNDFGALNVDAQLLSESSHAVYSLQNGCICCSVQNDLLAQLASLAQRRPRLERMLIECSGVSDPERILQTLAYPRLSEQMRLDALITLVDASNHLSLSGDYARLARAQTAAADILLLNKSDLVGSAELEQLRQHFDSQNSRALIYATEQAELPDALWRAAPRPPAGQGAAPHSHSHSHDGELGQAAAENHSALFVSWHWQGSGSVDSERLRNWLAALPAGIFRIKGLLRLGQEARPFWLQQVAKRTQWQQASKVQAGQEMYLVFIAQRGFAGREGLMQGLQDSLLAQQECPSG